MPEIKESLPTRYIAFKSYDGEINACEILNGPIFYGGKYWYVLESYKSRKYGYAQMNERGHWIVQESIKGYLVFHDSEYYD